MINSNSWGQAPIDFFLHGVDHETGEIYGLAIPLLGKQSFKHIRWFLGFLLYSCYLGPSLPWHGSESLAAIQQLTHVIREFRNSSLVG